MCAWAVAIPAIARHFCTI